jgi:N-acetylmuramoyl-L-alanine amidase
MKQETKDKYSFVGYSEYINNSKSIIHINTGHGSLIDGIYQTDGKMYTHKDFVFYEGLFNRCMGIHISNYLLEKEIFHTFVTDSNLDVSLPVRCTRTNNYVRKYSDRDHLFLDLHGNAAGVESANGIEIWTSPGKTRSDEYATKIYESLKEFGWKMRHDFSDGDPDKESRFYTLINTNCPAVLIEYGFFTNYDQAKLMMNPSVQKELARLTVEGILK